MSKLSEKPQKTFIEGIISLTRKAKGYVHPDDIPAENRERDIEIDTMSLGTALHGDRVSVRLLPASTSTFAPKYSGQSQKYSKYQDSRSGPTGEVVEVLLRSKVNFSGKIEVREGVAFCVPDDKKTYTDFILPSLHVGGKEAKDGDKVLVKLLEWSDSKQNPVAKIIEVLGKAGEHDAEMKALAMEKGFGQAFPADVAHEADAFTGSISPEEIQKRRDMRGIPTMTIDPKNAKDFDDALSIQKLSDGTLEVGIHIADVSHYVRPKTALDREAGLRGTSVYLVDRTIPMLPERLSNDLCSLRPDEDRLAFSAVFIFDPESLHDSSKGGGKKIKIIDSWFGKTIIRSQKRFVYEDAQEILDKGEGEFYEELLALRGIARKLEKERKENGAILFEGDELAIELDEAGVPTVIRKKERKEIHRMVEDFMLLANRRVAEFISEIGRKEEKLFVYRIHDEPNAERLRELATFVRAFGYHLKIPESGNISSKDLAEFLEKMEETPIKTLVHSTALRSMAKAVYSTKNIGHYGLSFQHYTHFTSPIRRYPDVLAHRLLFAYLNHEKIPREQWEEYESMLVYASEREKKATEAERDSIKYKQVEYMLGKTGEVFDGIITGVTKWGVYVAEKETLAEGMVSLRDMKDDFYTLDEKHYRLTGERMKRKYTLGDEVRVRLARASLADKTLDYIFEEENKK